MAPGLEVMPDPVHMLVEVDPQFGVHRLVKGLRRPSRLLREEFAELHGRLPMLWTNAYFAATTRGAPLAASKHCGENQKHD